MHFIDLKEIYVKKTYFLKLTVRIYINTKVQYLYMYINYIQRMFRWVDKGSYSNHILLKIEKSIFDKKWNLEGLHELS